MITVPLFVAPALLYHIVDRNQLISEEIQFCFLLFVVIMKLIGMNHYWMDYSYLHCSYHKKSFLEGLQVHSLLLPHCYITQLIRIKGSVTLGTITVTLFVAITLLYHTVDRNQSFLEEIQFCCLLLLS